MAHGTHDYDIDPRNSEIVIGINDDLLPREKAVVSVFDSGFMLGDGVWEGIRVHGGKLAFLDEHLRRLYEGAKGLDMDIGRTPAELTALIQATLDANGMGPDTDGVHIRLMITRGVKSTPYQDPRFTITPPTIVVIPEYKEARPETLTQGVRLYTVSIRRGRPDVQDPKWNSHSKLTASRPVSRLPKPELTKRSCSTRRGSSPRVIQRTSSSCATRTDPTARLKSGPQPATTACPVSLGAMSCDCANSTT